MVNVHFKLYISRISAKITFVSMPNNLFLQELKRLILLKNKIRAVSPSDCRIISLSIQKELKKNISETTIKRLFGFAEIKHEFSKFTINTLKEYAGMIDESTIDLGTAPAAALDESINQQRALAEELTLSTLQHIRNRCSVPFEMTIPRAFAAQDILEFYKSKFNFTAFIAQPGYGKSTLLVHLVQQLFLTADAPLANNMLLFFKADQLFIKDDEQFSLENKIKHQLGLYQNINLITHFNQLLKERGIRLFVLIDGFSDLVIPKNNSSKIFDTIIGFIASIGDSESIKLILSMRSTTWSRFYEKIRHSYFFKSKWFPGTYFNANDNANVPQLTETEVAQIFQKMSPLEFTKISASLKLQLKFPFHIQWYYQLKEEYPAFESYTNIVYYEIIARFIQEKIYSATYATEKVLFCKMMIQLTNYGRKGYSVNKIELIREMPVFEDAYDELLASGILMEEKQLKGGLLSEHVRFIQPHIFEYFLFLELYDVFNQTMDKKFFELINTEYTGNQVRFQLLQWAVRLMVKQHKFSDMEAVLNLNINSYEKNYLIYFIAENLNYNIRQQPKLMREIRLQALHSLLIKKLIHFDFIDSCYKDAVNCLLTVVDHEPYALFYHTILAVFDCISLDQDRIQARMLAMEKLSNARKEWTIDPFVIIQLIDLKIKGIDVSNDPILVFIDEFKKGNFKAADANASPDSKEIISFLLILLVNLFYGSPEGAIQIIESITTQYPKLKRTRTLFSIYLLHLLAQANARVNPGRKTDQMEDILNLIYADEQRYNITAYVQSVFLSLKAEQRKNRKEYVQALRYAKEGLLIYKRNELTISELYNYKFIISIYQHLGNEEKAAEYTKQKEELMERKNVRLI